MTLEKRPSLPIIDLGPLREGASDAEWRALGQALAEACRSTGFAYLVNHGIPQSTIDEWFDLSKRFFALPASEKAEVSMPKGSLEYRGWIQPEEEQVGELLPYSYNPDELERLGKVGKETKESYSCDGKAANFWPREDTIPTFRATCEDAMAKILVLRNEVVKLLAHGIPDTPLAQLQAMMSQDSVEMRMAHCMSTSSLHREMEKWGERRAEGADLSLPWKEVEGRNAAWLSPHTDWTMFTFVFQHQISGLEVEDPMHRTRFIPVEPIPGAIVFNVGDYLERLTNDQFKSTVHRVAPVRPPGGDKTEERYSMTFFNVPNEDALIDAFPGTWDESRPKKHAAVTVADWGGAKTAKAF